MRLPLRTSADDIRFAAQFDPSQAAASLSILFSFVAVQSRISKSNGLLADITVAKKELKAESKTSDSRGGEGKDNGGDSDGEDRGESKGEGKSSRK